MIQIGGVEFAKLKQSAVRLMQSAVRPEAIGGVVERFCGGSLRSRICTDFCFVKYFVKYWEKYFVKGGKCRAKIWLNRWINHASNGCGFVSGDNVDR